MYAAPSVGRRPGRAIVPLPGRLQTRNQLKGTTMEHKMPYSAPRLSEWGTVADLTQGLGQTENTDDFTCTVGKATFDGSTGHCPGTES